MNVEDRAASETDGSVELAYLLPSAPKSAAIELW
jgi:hypothetical protein